MNKLFLTAALILGFLLGLGFQHSQIAALKLANYKTLKDIAEKQATANAALVAYQSQVNKDQQKLKEENYDLRKKNKEFSDAADDAYASWLQSLDSASADYKSSTTKPGGPSKQDQATFDLFVKLLGGHTKELVQVGKYAEELKAAGLLCERSYDPLTK